MQSPDPFAQLLAEAKALAEEKKAKCARKRTDAPVKSRLRDTSFPPPKGRPENPAGVTPWEPRALVLLEQATLCECCGTVHTHPLGLFLSEQRFLLGGREDEHLTPVGLAEARAIYRKLPLVARTIPGQVPLCVHCADTALSFGPAPKDQLALLSELDTWTQLPKITKTKITKEP